MRRGIRHTGGVAMALMVLLAAPGAWAQTSDDVKVLLDRMERLERDIRTLNVNVNRGAPPPPAAAQAGAKAPPPGPPPGLPSTDGNPAVARLGVRMSELESDLRNATGAMEEISFHINEIKSRLDKLVADVDYRLGALEGRTGGAPRAGAAAPPPPRLTAAPSPPPVRKVVPGQAASFAAPPGTLGTVSQNAVAAVAPPAAGTPAPPAPAAVRPPAPNPAPAPPAPAADPAQPAVLPAGSAKEQYRFAFGLLRQANYDQAEVALQEFVSLHPNEPLTANARYWLGETFYVRSAFVQAAEVFLEGYQADPKGPKAPDSLLKLGMSLAALDKKREACAAFAKLIKDFPDVAAGVKSTVAREKQKSGCS